VELDLDAIPYLLLTPRLFLRCHDPAAAEALFEAVDESRAHIGRWMGWPSQHQHVADLRAWMRGARGRFDLRQDFELAIVRRDDERVVGGIGAHLRSAEFRAFEIGYWVRASETRKGYAREATSALVACLFEVGAERVQIRAEQGNRESCAIPEALGFQREGITRHAVMVGADFRDLVVYSRLRGD
jgi:RimJ/RimL family protein N-acetyltransferase